MQNTDNVGLQRFFGGQSIDRKYGATAQFNYSRHVDFRKQPGQFSVLPGTSKTSASNVTDLVEAMDQVPSGKRYALGDAGNVYEVSTAGVWSVKGTLGENGGAGAVYRADVDNFYLTGTTKVSRIKLVGSSATFEQNWFQRGRTTTSTCYKTGGSQTYAVPVAVAESATSMRTFVSDIEPFYSIKVLVIEAGTGDWTLTLHDDANNVLGTATITAANMTDSTLTEFVFASPVRALVSPNGRTYHFHLTSTVADGTVATTTAGSLADCDMELWANALIETVNGQHPITNFTNLTLIGNERYVAVYEPLQDSPTTADFQRHRLTLPPGFEVCGFAQKNLLCIIGAEKRSATGEFQEGMLFFWDGISQTYNDFYPVPEGAPESLFSHKNTAYFIAGGALYRIRGSDQPIKVRTFRNTDSELSGTTDVTHAPVNGMTVRRGILLIGYPFSTTNVSLEQGVYSYGAISDEYPESWGFSYTMSTGSYLNDGSNNLRIGMVKNYGDTLYISWRDDSASPTTYGVDIVNNSSTPASEFTLESLYFDNNMPFKRKMASKTIATFNALPAGCSVRLKYRNDRATTWTYSEYATEGDTYIVMNGGDDYYGIEFGIEGIVGDTTPEILSLYHFFDPNNAQRELP